MANPAQQNALEPSVFDGMDIEEAKRLKAVEEVKKLMLHNAVASRELCRRKQVLDILMPIVSRIIDDITTMPDILTVELAGQDVGTVNERLKVWSVDTSKKFAEALTIAEA